MLKSIYPVITSEKTLPFYLTGIGQTDPEYHIVRDKGLASHQFLFTIDGQGIFKCQGKTVIMKKNDLLYMPPGISHEYQPLEFLSKKRISQAKSLLENTDMTVAQVGQAVGYNDKNYFGIVFKAHEGISPGRWKKQ